ncbi:hypothetical protein NECAME_17459, partial [Necator americanus]
MKSSIFCQEYNLRQTGTFKISKRAAGEKPVEAEVRRGPELPRENGLGGGFQLVIQTPFHQNENVLSQESLLRHVNLMEEISKYEVELYGERWTLSDICFKPPGPNFNTGPLAKLMNSLLDKIIPCIWITPIDCYWEGSKPLGPNPPINLGDEVSAFVSSLPKGNVTWKNLNPTAVMTEVGALFDLGPIGNFFERAGIGAAYLDRPCIDPLDVECPKTSPNYFNRCAALEKFNEWNIAKDDAEKVRMIFLSFFYQQSRKKREATNNKKDDDYYAYEESDYDVTGVGNATKSKNKKDPKEIMCLEYGESLLHWMRANPDRWGEFLTEKEFPKTPDFKKVPYLQILIAREKYFSFYPMFAVLRGKTIDIPNQQPLIEEYRETLGNTKYIVKANGNLQPYWMSMVRTWLESLDTALEKELRAGNLDAITGKPVKGKEKPAPEALIARRLVCSYGHNYNCTGRVGHIKMVENGIIRPESFYNYLTGWYNVDNMMYYVSQASFQPAPPVWHMGPAETVVPPARKLLYSQIPFYQTNLTDTPAIVDMIE